MSWKREGQLVFMIQTILISSPNLRCKCDLGQSQVGQWAVFD